jgi:signal transduction histidine kinase/Tfp pilus assembly protein PilF
MAESMKRVGLLLLFAATNIAAQDIYRVDSLVTLLGSQSVDSIRCRIMLEIAGEFKTSDTVTALEYLESGKMIAEALADRSYLGRCAEIMGEMHTHFGQYDLAIIEFDRALAFYYEADNDIGYYETLKEKGNVHLFMSEYPQAMNYYETALDFYRRNNMLSGASRCLNNMGIIYKNRGQYLEALTVYDESIKYLDEGKDPMEVAQGYINMGNVFVYLGSYERALEYFEMALVIAERKKSRKEIALCLLNSGVVQNKCGNLSEANDRYRRSLTYSREISDPVLISNGLINIGTNYSDMGRLEEGLQYVERGLEMKRELGDDRTISNCYIHMAEIYYKMKDYDRATELFREAIPVKESLGDQEGLVRCYLGLARVDFDRRSFTSANRMTDLALQIATGINALEHLATGYEIKREIAEASGDFQAAYMYAMDSHRFNDSLMDENTSKAVMEMEFRHRSKVLEKENENLRIQSTMAEELIKKRNAFLYSIVGIAVLLMAGLVLVGYFLRRLRITSQKLEEKNLVITRQNLKLDTLNRTKDRMMSIIAHDLRGTIGNQLTALEVLHRVEELENPGIDRRKLLANLKHSASYSLELLENLLHWSRLQEGNSYFHPEEINLKAVITACISLFDETARNKGVSIEQNLDGIARIHADRIMLETIVRNLLSNAIKFSETGGTISISACQKEDQVVIELTDHGIGMTEEQIDQVMNNGGFTRRGTANEKGAGIGLTLVREFIAIHNGALNISSREGEGTSITVTFPNRS